MSGIRQIPGSGHDLDKLLGFVPLPTEADLLQMDEVDYMDEIQLQYFRIQLQDQLKAISQRALSSTNDLLVPETSADPIDRASAEEEHAISLRSHARDRKAMDDINLAIRRIECGEYGWCSQTGEAIGLRRLLAQPTATLCLDAQHRQETRGRYYARLD